MGDNTTFVQALSSYTGLSQQALDVWAQAENGAGNNVLGISKDPTGVQASGRQPNGYPTFSSPQAGAYATYQFMLQNGYSGILASAHGSPTDQLLAIKNSPWNTGRANDPSAYAGNVAFARGLGMTANPPTSGGKSPVGPGITLAHLPVIGDITIPGSTTAGVSKLGIGLMLGITALVLFVVGTKAVLNRQSVTTSFAQVPKDFAKGASTAAKAAPLVAAV